MSTSSRAPAAFMPSWPSACSYPATFGNSLLGSRGGLLTSSAIRHRPRVWLEAQPNNVDGDGQGAQDDEAQQTPPPISSLFNLDGPTPNSTDELNYESPPPTMLDADFASEGPLYEINASAEERLSQELDRESSGDDDDDAPFLSEAEYERASMSLGMDGSVRNTGNSRGGSGSDADAYVRITKILLESDAPPIPPDMMSSSPLPSDMSPDEILLSLASSQGSNKDEVDEDLHRRVMMGEDSDDSDGSERPTIQPKEKIEELVATKRNESYRRHRDEALTKLEREMEELMASLPSDKDDVAQAQSAENKANADRDIAMTCDGCGCKLSPMELEHAKSLGKGKKHLCQVCNAQRFIEKRPYAPDIPLIGSGSGSRFGEKINRKRVVKKRFEGPAQTYRDDSTTRNRSIKDDRPRPNSAKEKRKSSADPNAWRARYSGQSGGIARRVPVSGVSRKQIPTESNEKLGQKQGDEDATNEPSQSEISNDEEILETESEWVQAEDPDTGEYFFWNESTGEMRMDVPF